MNMAPRFMGGHSPSCSRADAENLGYFFVLGTPNPHNSNGFNVILCELRKWVILAFHHWREMVSQSPFPKCVHHIVRVCAKKKMPWIATRPNVTLMANMKTIGYFPDSQNESYAVRGRMLAFQFVLSISGLFGNRAGPQPAFIGSNDIHPRPKPFLKGWLSIPSDFSTLKPPLLSILNAMHNGNITIGLPTC